MTLLLLLKILELSDVPEASLLQVVARYPPLIVLKPKLKELGPVVLDTGLGVQDAPSVLEQLAMLYCAVALVVSHQCVVPVVVVVDQIALLALD